MRRFVLIFMCILMLSGCKTILMDTQPESDVSASGIGVGLVKVREADGSPAGWVKQITFTNGTTSISGSDATVTIAGVSPGWLIFLSAVHGSVNVDHRGGQ